MGSGKTIEGLAFSDSLYSRDIETFVVRIAHALQVNPSVFHYYLMSDDDDTSWQQEHLYDYGYSKKCRITVDRDTVYQAGKFCQADEFYYEVFLPVDFPYEDEISIEFCGNGIVYLQFLTYDYMWRWFTEKLYQACVLKQEKSSFLDRTYATKEKVEAIMEQLGIDRLLCYGEYHYSFAEAYLYESRAITDFQDIVDSARESDDLHIVDFDSLLQGNAVEDFPYDWLQQKPSSVALLHQIRLK